MTEQLKRDGLYPLRTYDGLPERGPDVWLRYRAEWTGEKRPPRKGEWYLSGAIIEAYRAPNDLTAPYHIARIVRVETVTIIRRVPADLSPAGR